MDVFEQHNICYHVNTNNFIQYFKRIILVRLYSYEFKSLKQSQCNHLYVSLFLYLFEHLSKQMKYKKTRCIY